MLCVVKEKFCVSGKANKGDVCVVSNSVSFLWSDGGGMCSMSAAVRLFCMFHFVDSFVHQR